jgi:hypothetical protein
VQVSGEAYLYLPEEAARLNLPIKSQIANRKGEAGSLETTCPVCGEPKSQCRCGEDVTLIPRPEPLRAQGVPQQAFQHLLDLCQDQKVTRLSTLRVTLRGDGAAGARNLRMLGLAVPQLGKGGFQVELTYNAEFGERQYLSSRATLDWELYRRLKQVTDALAQEAAKFVTTIALVARFPDGLEVQGEQFRTVHEVMTTVGLDTVELEAEALEAMG